MIFFDRAQETAAAWRHIREGRNLLMLAPRRIGKTMLLNRLRETAADQQFRAVVLDLEGYREEKDFFRQLCAAIQEELSTGAKVMTAFMDRLKRSIIGGGESIGDWRQLLIKTDGREFADHLLAHLDENGEEFPWLVLVDELPIFIQELQRQDGDAIRTFLYWLRNMRQKYKRVRWLYTGSIGLDSIARRHGVEGSLTDLELFPFAPFEPETARDFLDDIARRRDCSMTHAAKDLIIRRLGWLSPYYLEKVAEDACSQPGDGALDESHAQVALERLLDLEKRTYWSIWREHLDRNFPEPDRGRLYALLETAARDENGVTVDILLAALNPGGEPVGKAVLRDLLDTLMTDGYLAINNDNRYCFRMNLLREWWMRYVVL